MVTQFFHFGGVTDLRSCITLCGCKNYPNAGYKSEMSLCYCGADSGETCIDDNCINVYDSSGISSSFEKLPPSKVNVNSLFLIEALPMYLDFFGVNINKRVSISTQNISPVILAMPGNYSVSFEPNALWSCASLVQIVSAEVAVITSVYNGKQWLLSSEEYFSILLDLAGPNQFVKLNFKLYYNKMLNTFSDIVFYNPSASTFLEIGGNQETNRYQQYLLTFFEGKPTSVIVNLNHMISSVGYITAFSAFITKLGSICFLILEPFCETDKKMCFASRKCVQTNDPCPKDSYSFFPSNRYDKFYADSSQFGSSSSTQAQNINTRTAPEIGFKVVYMLSVNATLLGHNNFIVPTSEKFKASPGQFLAWMPDYTYNNPGDVAYNTADVSKQFQAINYIEIYDIFKGSVFVLSTSDFEICNTEHMVSLYIEVPSTYSIEVPVNFSDGTEITTKVFVTDLFGIETVLHNNSTAIVSVIENLKVKTNAGYYNVGSVVTFNVTATSGLAKAKFGVFWDENIVEEVISFNEVFDDAIFNHTFGTPGTYQVFVKAFTELSNQTVNHVLEVVCKLSLPVFFLVTDQINKATESIKPVETIESDIFIYVSLSGCGLVYISYWLESDHYKVFENFSMFLNDSSIFMIQSSRFKSMAQVINTTICVTNKIDTMCLSSKGYSEETINNLSIVTSTMETNVSGLLYISNETVGTNKTYCVDWGDKTSMCSSWAYDVKSLNHTYLYPGNYCVFFIAFNKVCSKNITFQIEVQDRILGCTISTSPTNFTTQTKVFFSIQSGTGMLLSLKWNDSLIIIVDDFDIVSNLNLSKIQHNFIGFKAFGSLAYSIKNDYKICLAVENDISSCSCCDVAIVEDPILDLTISIIQNVSGSIKKDYIEENETLTFVTMDKLGANRISYDVNFGNGVYFSTNKSNVSTSYYPWFMCYNYSVTATNPVSAASFMKEVCVQRPLYKINSLGFLHEPENSTEEMLIKFKFTGGNYIDCNFYFDDGASFSVSTTDFLGPVNFINTSHRFTAGNHIVSLSCVNRLFEFLENTTVLSQDPVSIPTLEFSTICHNGSSKASGNFKNVFSAACNLLVTIYDQKGSDVNETADVKVNGVYKRTFSCINSCVELPKNLWVGANVYTVDVCINTLNKVSKDLTCKQVVLIEPVVNVKATILSEKLAVNAPIYIKIEFLENVPGHPCIEIDYNDTNQVIYGGSTCNKNIQGDLNLLTPVMHKYKSSGRYFVEITGFNEVSEVTVNITLDVIELACSPPIIELQSPVSESEASLEEDTWFFKCENTTFSYRMQENCSSVFQYTMAKRIKVENKLQETWVSVEEKLSINSSKYILIGKKLENYGIYRITYYGEMVNQQNEPVAKTLAVKSGYFKIIPCPLRIIVSGGNEKTYRRGEEVIIDASQSGDPDNERSVIIAEWFCGRDGQLDGLNLDNLPETKYPSNNPDLYTVQMFPSEGCFTTSFGKGAKLSDKGHTSTMLILKSNYLWYFCYQLELRIKVKDDPFKRVAVQSVRLCLSDKPTLKVDMVCLHNCMKLINTRAKLTLTSIIENRGPTVKYEWKIYQRPKNDKTLLFYNVTDDFKNKTTTGLQIRNLVVKSDSFSPDYVYNFRVEVMSSTEKDTVVSAAALFQNINSPPNVTNSSCSVTPRSGIAAYTDFIISCTGITDENNPLFYSFEYKCANTEWLFLTLPTSTSPASSGKVKLPPGHPNTGKCNFRVTARDSYGLVSEPITENLNAFVSVERQDNVKTMCNDLKDQFVLSSKYLMANYIVVLFAMKDFILQSCKILIENSLTKIEIETPESALLVLQNVQVNGNKSIALSAIENIASNLHLLTTNELINISTLIFNKTSLLGEGEDLQAAQNAATALKIESVVSAAVGTTLVFGEPSVVTTTPTGQIQVQQIDSGVQYINSFVLPDIGGNGGGAISTFSKNRYIFDKKTDVVIRGQVKGLSLTNTDGTPKVVSNLSVPIKVELENDENQLPEKNFSAYCEIMRDVHQIEVTVNTSIIVIHAKPINKSFEGSLFLFLNKGTAPSLVDHMLNCTLPHHDEESEEKKWRCFYSEKDLNREAIGLWCVGVIFYTNEHPLATKLLPLSAQPSEDNCTAPVKYFFQAYTRVCLFWDKNIGSWSSEGCYAIKSDTTIDKTICNCTHLTDFAGGGSISTTDSLNLASGFRNFDLNKNPTVFSVVIVLFGVYFILLLWARMKDKHDIEKSKLIPLPDNNPEDQFFYEIAVQTGFKSGSSSTADIVIELTGSTGESGPRRLVSNSRKCFQKGETDFFLLALPTSIGEIYEAEIWHNNAGPSPGWFLLKVQVCDLQNKKRVDFLCNRWLDVAEGDGRISRTLRPSNKEDITEFNYLFSTSALKNLYDGHIWLSVFTRSAQSSFTRCQRLTACMSLLLTSMLGNAMLYDKDHAAPTYKIMLGPVTISINEMRNALIVALMVIPCNLLIVFLFKKAGPKISKKSMKYEVEESRVGSTENISVSLDYQEEAYWEKYNACIHLFHSLFFAGADDETDNDTDRKMNKKRKPLPHWLVYLAYAISFITTSVSAYFVIMYGFQFGKFTSEKWLISMFFSLLYSIFLFKPFEVILLTLLFAVLLKTPPSSGHGTGADSIMKIKDGYYDDDEEIVKVLTAKPKMLKHPEERELKEYYISMLKEKKIKLIIREIIVHVLFLLLIIIVVYSASDPDSFQFYQSVNQLCVFNGINKDYYRGRAYESKPKKEKLHTANQVQNVKDWYDWARYSVIDYLFPDVWYSNRHMFPNGYVSDSASSKVLSMARFRQLRIKPNSCVKHPVFKDIINECNAGYSFSIEQDKDFKAGWLPPLNLSERMRRRRGKRISLWKGLEDPWLYQSALVLKNPVPFNGFFNIYSGSSYSVSIGPNRIIAKKILNGELKKKFWIDRYTRAVFTEINIYNANTNLMLIVTILHEVLPTGGWNFYSNIQPLRLYRYVGGLGDLIILFDLLFVIATLRGLYKALRAAHKSGVKEYLLNTWNFLHVVVTTFSLLTICLMIGSMIAVKNAVLEYTDKPEEFISFQLVGNLQYLSISGLGFVLFFGNLEMLRILRFNRRIALLLNSFSVMSAPLLSFGIIFGVVLMAFVSFAYMIYVDKLFFFRSISSSFTTMFLGKFDVSLYFQNAPVFGPIMFITYMLSIQIIMVNLLIGFICESFNEASRTNASVQEPNVMEYVTEKIKKINSKTMVGNAIYTEWSDEWGQLVEGLEECCDNCIYIIRNMEGEEYRQARFFEKEDVKKDIMLIAILGLDFFTYESEFCDGLTIFEKKLHKLPLGEAKTFLLQAFALRHDNMQEKCSTLGFCKNNERDYKENKYEANGSFRRSDLSVKYVY